MRLPRVLTVDERRMVSRALAMAASMARNTLAEMRTSELLSRDAQQRQRDQLQLQAETQDRMSILFNDTRSMDVAFIKPENQRRKEVGDGATDQRGEGVLGNDVPATRRARRRRDRVDR